jgi:chromosomal replication initiation ATPase DnaA
MDAFWDKTSKLIQEKISKQNFDTWIKPIKVVAMEDKCVQLAVPNKFFIPQRLNNPCKMPLVLQLILILSCQKIKKRARNLRQRTRHTPKMLQLQQSVEVKTFLFLMITIILTGSWLALVINLLTPLLLP